MQEEKEGVQEQLATDQELHQPEADSSQSQGTEKPKTAEYNFKEMRRKFDELNGRLEVEKRDKEELKRQLEQIQTGVKRAFLPNEEESQKSDELLTVGELEKRLQKQKEQDEIEATPRLYPDYYEVVKFVEPLVKENPALLDAIQNSRNPRLAAYQLVKNSYAYRSTVQKQDAKEVEKNLSKPIPSEAIAGGSGIDTNNGTMSLAEKAEVWKTARRYARGA